LKKEQISVRKKSQIADDAQTIGICVKIITERWSAKKHDDCKIDITPKLNKREEKNNV